MLWAIAVLVLFVCELGLSAQRVTGDVTWQERWDYYVDRTFDWQRISLIAAGTAVDSVFEETFEIGKCGRPPYCYPHDFGGAIFRRTARSSMELGAGALLHEDIRRRPSNLAGFRPRLKYALVHAALARGPDGQWQPAYSRFLGTFAADTVDSAWRGRALTSSRLFGRFGVSATTYFQDALWTEFKPDVMGFAKRFAARHFSRFR